MKNLFFRFCLLACIALFSFACSCSEKLQGNEYLIEGKISDVEDGILIRLVRREGNVFVPMAFDTLRNGRFTFKEEATSNPEWMAISPYRGGFPSMHLIVWVAPGAKIKIKGKGKLNPLWEVKSSVPYQKEENLYQNKSRDIIAERARIAIESKDLLTKLDTASSEKEALTYKKSYDSLTTIELSLWIKQLISEVDIMEQTNTTEIWFDKMRWIATALRELKTYMEYEQYDYLRQKADEQYGRMSEEHKKTAFGAQITAYLFPPDFFKVGDNMPDADLLDIDGNTKRIADYLGKYLLLDFWSRGCGPCIMALPEMKEISEIYHDKLTIISISLDTDAVWRGAMDIYDVPWVNIRDPKAMGGLAASYNVSGIPNYIMISPEGKIIDRWMGFAEGFLKMKVGENIN